MYSTNNSGSEKDYIYCRNDCGARITFSNNANLQENGLPHNCPKSPFNRGRQEPQVSTKFVREIENTIVPPGGGLGIVKPTTTKPKKDDNRARQA